ncbi:MAG: DUF3043 domain-containing protein [Frankia sp.]
MALLKRRTTVDQPTAIGPVDDGAGDAGPVELAGGKGRPTPKRSQARAARPKGSSSLTTGGRSSAKGSSGRDERRRKTSDYRASMQSTDVSKLPAREQVAERVLARDYVDRRRNVGPLFLVAAVIYFVGVVIPSDAARIATTVIMLAGVIAVVGDSLLLSVLITRRVEQVYPGSRVRVRAYAAQRALLPRRWRLPKPRVSRTDPEPLR